MKAFLLSLWLVVVALVLVPVEWTHNALRSHYENINQRIKHAQQP